jgi:hypothetical protein
VNLVAEEDVACLLIYFHEPTLLLFVFMHVSWLVYGPCRYVFLAYVVTLMIVACAMSQQRAQTKASELSGLSGSR